jgi:predicted dehydrogenase
MPVKLGCLGFGIMGERLLRAALTHDPNTILVSGIFDPSPGAAARLAALGGNIPVFDSASALIAASDCLHIASPPLSHLDYLKACAQAGKAVLCEKPLATDVVAATKTVAALTAQDARAAVNFPFASSFAVEQLQHWLDDGIIGKPERIDIALAFAAWPRSWQMDAVSWLDRRAEGGFMREVGSHFLFLSRRLIGPLQLKTHSCTYPDPSQSERHVDATFTTGNLPVRLIGSVGSTSVDDHNTWTLTGSKGRIRLRDWSFAERETDGTWAAPATALANEKARPLVLARQLDKIAAMTHGNPTNLATLSEALEVQTCIEAILRG